MYPWLRNKRLCLESIIVFIFAATGTLNSCSKQPIQMHEATQLYKETAPTGLTVPHEETSSDEGTEANEKIASYEEYDPYEAYFPFTIPGEVEVISGNETKDNKKIISYKEYDPYAVYAIPGEFVSGEQEANEKIASYEEYDPYEAYFPFTIPGEVEVISGNETKDNEKIALYYPYIQYNVIEISEGRLIDREVVRLEDIIPPKPEPEPEPKLEPKLEPEPKPSNINQFKFNRPTPPEFKTANWRDELNKELARLPIGRIAFNPPERMKVGIKERIEVRISKDPDADIVSALTGQGVPQIEEIKVYEFMKVKLTGEEFDIDPLNEEEQIIGPQGYTEWAWEVLPRKSGEKFLHLHVSLRIKIPFGEKTKDHPVMDKAILVKINPIYTAKVFCCAYWQWIATAIILPLIAFIWRQHKSEKRPKAITPA